MKDIALKRGLPVALVAAASVWIAFANTGTGDYLGDAWPAVHALAHGHLGAYVSAHPMMGPFATLVQAPFAAMSGANFGLVEYQWASIPCVFAAGLLGLYLAGIARRRGASGLTQLILPVVCLFNPLTFVALKYGHPEEILTSALVVGAVATAWEGHGRRTAILLGLAVASKQWAVLAILPVLMALPARRVRVGLGAGAIALLLILPGVLASPDSFTSVQGNAAATGSVVTPWSVWYPTATVTTETVGTGAAQVSADVHRAAPLVGSTSHPLIVLLVFAVPLGLALFRRSFRLSGPDAMALLALLALLRCALDPVDNLYYHEPLLLALVGLDALTEEGLPWRSLLGVGVATLFWRWTNNLSDPQVLNVAYLLVICTTGALIAKRTFVRPIGEVNGSRPGVSAVFGKWGGNFLAPDAGKVGQ